MAASKLGNQKQKRPRRANRQASSSRSRQETSSSIQVVYSRVRYSKDNKNTPGRARQYKTGECQ